jgi:hypothetical protein
MIGRVCWYLSLAAKVARPAPQHLIEPRGVLLGHRRSERAGKVAGGIGEIQVGVHDGELPAWRVPERQTRAGDIQIEGLGGRAHGGRRRQQGGAVGQRFLGQIAFEKARANFWHGSCLVGQARGDRQARKSQRQTEQRNARTQPGHHNRSSCIKEAMKFLATRLAKVESFRGLPSPALRPGLEARGAPRI